MVAAGLGPIIQSTDKETTMKNISTLVRSPRPLCLALLALCTLQAQAQLMDPGYWQYWRSESVQAPSSKPNIEICLSTAKAKDVLTLMAEHPGDTACKASNIRKRADGGLDFDVVCDGSGKFSASSTVSSNRSVLLTQIVPVSGHAPGTKIGYIHAKRLQSCSQ
jgi:Protein of unknown function (DUF3617)